MIWAFIEEFLVILAAGAVAGIIGALAGLGGGTVISPILTLFLGIPMAYASGSALISTIATSAGSASVYVKKKIANDRIGISLTTATTAGAILGSIMANYVYVHGITYVIYTVFGIVLLVSIVPTVQRSTCELPRPRKPDLTTKLLNLYGTCFDPNLGWIRYWGVRWWLGEFIMFFAGVISGLLGIGSGALKVLGLDWAMNLPMKVSTTTSNFMIGVTAATGSSIYWYFGYIQPFIAAATAIGVLIGAQAGTRILMRITNKQIRWVFVAILSYLGFRMLLRGLGREGLMPISSLDKTFISLMFSAVMISSLYYLMARRPVDEELPPIYTAQLTKGSSIEERFEGITSNLLRIGIFLSVAVMGLGLALVVLHGGGLGHSLMDVADPSSRVNTASISIKTIIAGLQEWDGISFMLLGLVLLIIMPIAMVLINVVRFSLERDKWYTLFAVITLVNLLIALLVVPGLVPH
ncbi:hypothetical protein GCM10007981_05520 [Thermocladium modestius]|uniref:Probable membrane transporter protein n=1 Tax=Thermocladium modestius TaxID=62609 RepID=A0A830GS12_9CREN|nr:TSUP family transporter [Thermocladium modestius]GGP19914.1 hypothetical protein GCM10007981_05520 [Thermocladium modestius]